MSCLNSNYLSRNILAAKLRRNTLLSKLATLNGKKNYPTLFLSAERNSTSFVKGVIPHRDQPYNSSLSHYLLGQERPTEKGLVLAFALHDHDKHEERLYRLEQKDHQIIWDGKNIPSKELSEITGIEKIENRGSLKQFIEEFRNSHRGARIYSDKESIENLKIDIKDVSSLCDATKIVEMQQLIKDDMELSNIKISVNIAAESLKEVIKNGKKAKNEKELETLFNHQCSLKNSPNLSFPPVVASGKNSVAIHYLKNSDPLLPDSTVMMDVGCTFFGYCSDITRTWPLS
ncbi:MAG: Xaa-Pro aminopeptidase 3, partial [Paramarteilia canceri]